MINIYCFANILKHSRKIQYDITNVEADMIKIFSLKPWIQLVNKYVNIKYKNYSIKHMLQEYSKGNINLELDYIDTVINYGEFTIYSDVAFLKKFYENNIDDFSNINSRHVGLNNNIYLQFMLDDKNMYNNSSTWFVMYKDRIIQRLTILQSSDSAYKLESLNPVLKDDFLYSSLVMTKFILEKLKFKTTYRVIKKNSKQSDKIPKMKNIDELCVGQGFNIPQKSLNLARYENKESYYIQYYDRKIIKNISLDKIRRIYKCQKIQYG